MFRNIVVGISGGVDSAVTAFLLKEKGFKVLGVFMKNWDQLDDVGYCSGEKDLADAEKVCRTLDIELRQVNYVKEYWNFVFSNLLVDYENGLTPNPDVLCNKYIKFNLFYKYAIAQLKYDAIATGHYARTSFGAYLENYDANNDVRLLLPKDLFKDQTFFLSAVNVKYLGRVMFPLANLLKSEVRDIARSCGLNFLLNKKESTGICFIGKRDFQQFIKEYIPAKPGNLIDIDTGDIIGRHEGIHQWTLGQRYRMHSCLKAYFVTRKDVALNTMYLAAGTDHPSLYSDLIYATTTNWFHPNALRVPGGGQLKCSFRFQHTKPLVECVVHSCGSENRNGNGNGNDNGNELIIELRQQLRAITPGQYAVFYSGNECLGSARITLSTKSNTKQRLHQYTK